MILSFVCASQRPKCTPSNRRFCKIEEIDPVSFHLLPGNKTRGEACTVDGRAGTCESWRHCYTMIVDHIENKFPTVCSYDGADPIVCCTSCKLVDDVSKAKLIHANGYILWKTNQKAWNQCIAYSETLPYQCNYVENWSVKKVWNETGKCFEVEKKLLGAKDSFGGRDAYRGEFPQMALLGYGPEDTAQWLCGGSIISDRYILTAAHCISSASLGSVRYAAVGILKRSDPEELWQKYRIEKRIPHGEYKAPSKYHDIALLKTELPINFTTFVMPACLPDLSRPPPDIDMFAFAAGWGAKGHRAALADTLQAVDVNEYSSKSCSDEYREHRHLLSGYDHITQMCYGDMEEAKDTCEGDSGGPLLTRGQVVHCQHGLIGVTSFGHACGQRGHAGIYTRVRHYVPWIESIVWPDP